ncbi:spermatogenesis-associated protein 20 isoform X2 [Cephus cinctus]|uniref:Spermatogenesis-associated protein 20 isoform X2 n=1 Tax=Cephus cinctus TaxID=211228 RepID=A0AAJ7BNV5_CEPCN|nr:spermatogenesis-associated protein 20 isoform X2 [Cephus cinctus]
MIFGRCAILATVRQISEFSKQFHNSNKGISFSDSVFRAGNRRQIERSSQDFPVFLPLCAGMASTSGHVTSHGAVKEQNRLSLEKSPYLRQHATNPVQWYPWGNEALEKAQREDKPIFLSVGYSTCHWCHVMERESFENTEIASVMNKFFVNIKVDREERPDIDKIYMTFIQAISGHGGWPMSVFLTPDLKPITGGTYFPPVDKYGQPGFKTILLSVAHKWAENKSDILESGCRILDILMRSTRDSRQPKERIIPPIDVGYTCVRQLASSYDDEFGGFTTAPKFPQPVNFNLLFHMYAREPTGALGEQCLKMCLHTLKKMAHGGIHDHIGQGFARYSVDGKWHVPHFEKMLYDQGQLLRSYTDAYIAKKDAFFLETIDDIVTYVTRDLRHKEGGFYSAEDADSLLSHDSNIKREGAFYVWTHDEVEDLLSKEIPNHDNLRLSDIFCYHYNVKPEGNVAEHQDPHGELTGQNVLIIYGSLIETAEHFGCSSEEIEKYLKESRAILFEHRSKRPRPHLDDKIITAWNGLMISGLSIAGLAVNNVKYIKYAEDAANFVERYLFNKETGLLLRSCYRGDNDTITQCAVPINGFHVDYAFMVRGLLDLYEASFEAHWLELAEKLQATHDEHFWDEDAGGYFATTKDDPSVILRLKDDHDGAEPSSNSVACSNLLRLASYLDRTELNEKAEKLLSYFHESITRIPAAFPELVSALMLYHDNVTQIYIAGRKDSDDTKELLRVVRERIIPGRVLLLADRECSDNILFRRSEVMGNMKSLGGRATAYVCRRHTCSLPVTEPGDFAALLDVKP